MSCKDGDAAGCEYSPSSRHRLNTPYLLYVDIMQSGGNAGKATLYRRQKSSSYIKKCYNASYILYQVFFCTPEYQGFNIHPSRDGDMDRLSFASPRRAMGAIRSFNRQPKAGGTPARMICVQGRAGTGIGTMLLLFHRGWKNRAQCWYSIPHSLSKYQERR